MNDPFAIPNETRLFRRINPNWTTYDANRKERRPSSQNFQDSPDGTPMSVFAENIARAAGELPPDFLTGQWSGFYLAAVTAGWMRSVAKRYIPTLTTRMPMIALSPTLQYGVPKTNKSSAVN
jgi:hypothetical protein